MRNAGKWTRNRVALRAAETTSTPPFKVHTLPRVRPARQVCPYTKHHPAAAHGSPPGIRVWCRMERYASWTVCVDARFRALAPLSKHYHKVNMGTPSSVVSDSPLRFLYSLSIFASHEAIASPAARPIHQASSSRYRFPSNHLPGTFPCTRPSASRRLHCPSLSSTRSHRQESRWTELVCRTVS